MGLKKSGRFAFLRIKRKMGKRETQLIETNLGELIAAIDDAARESGATASEMACLTQEVLKNLLNHPKRFPRETVDHILAFLRE